MGSRPQGDTAVAVLPGWVATNNCTLCCPWGHGGRGQQTFRVTRCLPSCIYRQTLSSLPRDWHCSQRMPIPSFIERGYRSCLWSFALGKVEEKPAAACPGQRGSRLPRVCRVSSSALCSPGSGHPGGHVPSILLTLCAARLPRPPPVACSVPLPALPVNGQAPARPHGAHQLSCRFLSIRPL